MEGINTTLDHSGNGGGGGGEAAKLAVSITYANLKALRDGGNLVPGTWYRITNYACTTTQQDTQSANHAFDIIVRADDESHLNENAYAAHHEGDTYFANCKLEAWELKYCLDNDTNRFAWADDENGTGVIFYMKDEWNNECPYDFKNIMFKRVKVSGEYVEGSYDAANFLYLGIPGDIPEVFDVEDESDTIWVYTFNGFDDLEDVTQVRDVSVKGMLTEDERFGGYPDKYHPSNGVMKARQAFQVVDDEDGHEVQLLNNIVFVQMYTMTYNYEVDGYDFNAGCYNMTIGAKRNEGLKFGAHCHDFAIGAGCYGSSFGSDCHYNTFGTDCYLNTFGNYCNNNSFGNSCSSNTFGNGCDSNSFGNDCYSNSFGNYCRENSFGNGFQYNSFGNSCYNNSFGNSCSGNSFGNSCGSNTFGNSCYNNSFGNNCQENSFGNYCRENSFGNDCDGNSFGNYCQNITVFDGVQYCSVTGGSSSAPVKNAQILNGTAGASAQNKLTIGFAANKAYTQVAAKTTAGNLKIFNPADLVQ